MLNTRKRSQRCNFSDLITDRLVCCCPVEGKFAKTVEIQETYALPENPLKEDSGLVIIAGIPAHNEEKSITRIVLGAQRHAHIVIVCDDGSVDNTATIAESLGAVVIRHSHNLGYGAALDSLFIRARELNADVLVTLDADGQHDPLEIPGLTKPIEDGVAEVVIGSRFIDKNGTAEMPAYRQLGIKLITSLSSGFGKDAVSDAQSGFRAYSKNAIEKLGPISHNGMSASIELIRGAHRRRLKLCEVPISCKYKTAGVETSSKNPVFHGLGLIVSIVKLVVGDKMRELHPLE
jgi:glycosyltransferase involved in cell wall biosynthesis